jgi:hypothetical protein
MTGKGGPDAVSMVSAIFRWMVCSRRSGDGMAGEEETERAFLMMRWGVLGNDTLAD